MLINLKGTRIAIRMEKISGLFQKKSTQPPTDGVVF